MSLKYEITESVLPVREYGATLKVESAGEGKTIVTWRAMFKRKDPANPGAAGQDDAAAKAAISAIFKSGLENIKKISE
jgi:mxaD protein